MIECETCIMNDNTLLPLYMIPVSVPLLGLDLERPTASPTARASCHQDELFAVY